MNPRELLRALMDSAGLNPNSLSNATRGRTRQPQIHRFLTGEAKEPKRSTLLPVAEYFGIPVEALFSADEARKVAEAKGLVPAGTGVAQPMSLTNIKVAPQRVQWRNLMSLELPDEFRTEAPDDALAPRLRAGQGLTLDTRVQPRAGDAVLVSDRTGALHLRIYTPGVGRWEGQVENKAYLVLDSERDGLQVKAVLTAVEGRWG
jgi:hypothetical protein